MEGRYRKFEFDTMPDDSINTVKCFPDVRPRSLEELDETICSICQVDFKDPIITICTHVFCRRCIKKWMRNHRSCPICRDNVKIKL